MSKPRFFPSYFPASIRPLLPVPWVVCFACLVAGVAVSHSQKVYQEAGGLVVMEAENTESDLGTWVEGTSVNTFTGSGYLEMTSGSPVSGQPRSPVEYHFKINQAGLYRLHLHCAKLNQTINGEFRTDIANDCYVRVEGDYGAGPNPGNSHGDDAPLAMLMRDTKFFGGSNNSFSWASGNRLDPGGHNNKRIAVYDFKAGETYRFVVSGRSRDFKINRFVFRHVSVGNGAAQKLSNPESETVEIVVPPHAWPGQIEAEDFGPEGAGTSYSDSDPENNGGAFRADEGVDIQTTSDAGGGFNVGWTAAGEWLEYLLDVSETAAYDIHIRVASSPGGGAFRLLLDGGLVGRSGVPATGGWQVWQTISFPGILIREGEGRKLRLEIDQGGFNINWTRADLVSAASAGTYFAWVAGHPSMEGHNTSPGADANGDGVPNLLHFVQGGSLTGEETDPRLGLHPMGDGSAMVTFPIRKDITGASGGIELSGGLEGWAPVDLPASREDMGPYWLYSMLLPSGEPRMFVRYRASLDE